jgi:hypothetical protein
MGQWAGAALSFVAALGLTVGFCSSRPAAASTSQIFTIGGNGCKEMDGTYANGFYCSIPAGSAISAAGGFVNAYFDYVTSGPAKTNRFELFKISYDGTWASDWSVSKDAAGTHDNKLTLDNVTTHVDQWDYYYAELTAPTTTKGADFLGVSVVTLQ